MNKSSGNLSTASQEYRHCDVDPIVSTRGAKEITITVDRIENLDTKVKEVIVIVEFDGNTLKKSQQLPIFKSGTNIDLTAVIDVEDSGPEFLNAILANPVLFTVLDCTHQTYPIPSTSPPPVEVKKKTQKSSTAASPVSKPVQPTINVLGICNLDLGSLVMGVKEIKETLLVEADQKPTPLENVVWCKLPKLVVSASTGDSPLVGPFSKICNVLGITVESIYNVPESVLEGSVFDAFVQVPTIDDKTYKIKFPFGVLTPTKETCCRKKWVNLSHIDGPGARSKHRIASDTCDIINFLPGKETLENEMKSRRMIRWDMWKSCLMYKADMSYFQQKIMKYNVWPIEIVLPHKSKDQIQKEKSAKSDKKSKSVVLEPPTSADHFSAFLNLAPLLYPGVTKVRVAAQLMTYSQTDLVNKFGAEFNPLQAQASIATVKGKTASEKSKVSIPEYEEIKDSPGTLVFNEDGKPTFIVVEVELLKPLCQKRDTLNSEECLKDHLSIKGRLVRKTTNFDVVYNNFSESILDTVSMVVKEYQAFFMSKENSEDDEEKDVNFYKFFCKGKDFIKLRRLLGDNTAELINEKFGSINCEKRIPIIYAYLVNEMYKITSTLGQKTASYNHFNNNQIQLYAEEAFEEEDFELAQEYLFLKLSRNTSNPDYWLDIAVYYIRLEMYERAEEATREALHLDFHHQIGLLIYALLMMNSCKSDIAEMAFEILLLKYPDFSEGWMILRLFYIRIANYEGAIIARREAKAIECEKYHLQRSSLHGLNADTVEPEFCLKVHDHAKYESAPEEKYGVASFLNGVSWSEPLGWTTSICPPANLRIRTTVLLLKLGFYQFAAANLSEELLSLSIEEDNGRLPPTFVYYTSVNHYLQRQYLDAIPLLRKYAKEYGQDCYIWSLLGHCYYKLENHTEAIACYDYVLQSFNRPDDIHLVHSRMGHYYLQGNKYQCAKKMFKTVCKNSPTPKMWKALGTTCLMNEEFEDAEIAFTEANYLDNKDPETWAYLAITNAFLRRLDLFKQCYAEAIKRGLNNMELLQKIKCIEKINGMYNEESNA